VLLRWKTDAEVAGFDVLHQADYGFRGASNARETKEEVGGFEDLHRTNSELRDPGSEWKIAGYVEGNRSSEAVESYSYSIPDLESGHHFFRLKQINLDGSVGYSREVIVTIDLPSAFVIGDVYPNPVIDMAILPFHVATTQVVSATLHDVLGRQIRSLGQIQAVADTRHAFQIDAVDLPAGSYFVLLRGERFAATKKVLTVR